MKHIIIVGNAIDGLSFIGPFEDHDAAVKYAEGLLESWCIGELEAPQEED